MDLALEDRVARPDRRNRQQRGRVTPRLGGFLSITDADFEASLQLDFLSAVRATRAAVADMLPRKDGAIVNVASVNATFHPDGLVADYGAAKAALLNLAKALSQELGPHRDRHRALLDARRGGDARCAPGFAPDRAVSPAPTT